MASIRRSVLVDGIWMEETEPIRRYLQAQRERGLKVGTPSPSEDVTKLSNIQMRMHMRSNSGTSKQNILHEEETTAHQHSLQREALEKFYRATWGWQIVDHWLTDDLTLWNGLQHDSVGQTLLQIVLSNNNINGPLPPELGSLLTLKKIDLSGNKITGTIPMEWHSLAALEELTLAHNRITGPVTGTLRKLSSLRFLDIRDNWIDGTFPAWLDGLENLQVAHFGSNDLSGPVPTSLVTSSIHGFTFLIGLTELAVPYNQLSGPLPQAMGNLKHLRVVDMESNQLSGPIPESLGKLEKLEALNLRWNELTGSIPDSLSGLTSLRTLRLNHNKLTGPLPSSLTNLSSLEELNVTGNQLQGSVPTHYQELSKLQLLAIVWNQLDVNHPTKEAAVARKALRKLFPKTCMVVCVMEDADAEIIRAQETLHEQTRKSHQRRRDPDAEEQNVTKPEKSLSMGKGLLRGLSSMLTPNTALKATVKQQQS